MVRRAKAKAKAAAARVEQGAEPEAELTPRSVPKQKPQKEKTTLPEPDPEFAEVGVDIRIPLEKSVAVQKQALGTAIYLALQLTMGPVPKKPCGYSAANWSTMFRMLRESAAIRQEECGSKKQSEFANALVTLLNEIPFILMETNEDPNAFQKLMDLSFLVGPLAQRLYELHLVFPESG